MALHWSLSESKSQVSRTILSILDVLNYAVVWMVSTRPSTSKSASPFYNFLVTVPKAPITIGMIVTFTSHIFFQLTSKIQGHILFFTFFQFYSVVNNFENSLFFKLLLGLCFLLWFGDTPLCQSPTGVYVGNFQGQMLGCAYNICWYGQFQFLAHLPVDHRAHPVVSIFILLC